MANTTFSGPVRSEAGFQVATKNATTGSVIESRSGGEADFDISAAGETQLVFTAANAATNLLTTGSMIAFICYETGTWHIATKLGGAAAATTGAFAFAA
jgi:hypothetical protein